MGRTNEHKCEYANRSESTSDRRLEIVRAPCRAKNQVSNMTKLNGH
jgi:hypothetical protein